MKRKEMIAMLVIVLLCMLWIPFDRYVILRLTDREKFEEYQQYQKTLQRVRELGENADAQSEENAFSTPEAAVLTAHPGAPASNWTVQARDQETQTARIEADSAATNAPAAQEPQNAATEEAQEERQPEQLVVLTNNSVILTFTSRGGCIFSATMRQYRETVDKDSRPVTINFSSVPAMAYSELPDLTQWHDFELLLSDLSNEVRFARTTHQGMRLVRTFRLTDEYRIEIVDHFENMGEQPIHINDAAITLGSMTDLPGDVSFRGINNLGVVTLSPSDDRVRYWSSQIPGQFVRAMKAREQHELPDEISYDPWRRSKSIDWAAVHNKYFTQILRPEFGSEQCIIQAERLVTEHERDDPKFKPTKASHVELASVAAKLEFDNMVLKTGEIMERKYFLFIGPKKLRLLEQLGYQQELVMGLGQTFVVFSFMRPFMLFMENNLLRLLNFFYLLVRNYGLAIILLTVIVKLALMPITRKGMKSMKRMQELQPMMEEIKKKYKDPQRQQQEIMALYKEHKVNPMAGCLPMFVQIPVLIALWRVFGKAIELRYAEFLWIPNLSEAEKLVDFGGFHLNILPILMAATMMWQQRLTPTTGDAQQQKMMARIMPIMLLVMFYNMPSGVVLYWTVSQCVAIVELLTQKKNEQPAREVKLKAKQLS